MTLRIYETAVTVVREMGAVAREIAREDPGLARQMRRAVTSMLLNLAEGSGSQGRNQRAKFWLALGSARETKACVDAGVALTYVESVDAAAMARLEHVTAVLVRLVR